MRSIGTLLTLVALTQASLGTRADSLGPTPRITVDQVLEHQVRALGGRRALGSIRTRISRGFMVNPDGQKAALEIDEKSPERFRVVMDVPAGRSMNGYDGSVAWTQPPGSPAESRPVADAGFVIREHRLDRPLATRTLYDHLRVVGSTVLGGRKSIVLEAAGADSVIERWYFDAKTWLPARIDMTIQGTPIQAWFEDYRRVDGVKVPFRVRRSRPDFSWTYEFTTIEQNVPLDDSVFAKPTKR